MLFRNGQSIAESHLIKLTWNEMVKDDGPNHVNFMRCFIADKPLHVVMNFDVRAFFGELQWKTR